MSTLDHRKRLSVERRNVRAFRDLACNQVARAVDEKGYLPGLRDIARAGNAMLRVIPSAAPSASSAVASSFGDVIGGAALFGPAAPAGAFWAAARCVAAMEQKTTAENPPAQLQASRGARFHGTYPPTRCEVHSIQTFAMPARERAEPNGAVADARFRRAEIRRTPARRRCGALRACRTVPLVTSAASPPLRRCSDRLCSLTSSVDLTKPRSRVISTFRCSAARSGSMLGSW